MAIVKVAIADTVHVSDSSVALDPWGNLEKELARIRRRLEEDDSGSVDPDDRGDAIESVTAAQEQMSDTDQTSPDARRSMRRAIKALIGILTPVTEVIGGVAALEAIWQHL